ncbi:MAG: hypothetical protein GY757_38975 [bacterium]|nr:hypothetical protein [bacterium]
MINFKNHPPSAAQKWTARIFTALLLALAIHFIIMDSPAGDYEERVEINLMENETEIISAIKKLERKDITIDTREYDPKDNKITVISAIAHFFIAAFFIGIYYLVYVILLQLFRLITKKPDETKTTEETPAWETQNLEKPGYQSGECKKEPSIFDTKNRRQIWTARILSLLVFAIILNAFIINTKKIDGKFYPKKIEIYANGDINDIIATVKKIREDNIVIFSRKLNTEKENPQSFQIISFFFIRISVALVLFLTLYSSILWLLQKKSGSKKPAGEEPPTAIPTKQLPIPGATVTATMNGLEISIPGREVTKNQRSRLSKKLSRFFLYLWLVPWSIGGILVFITVLMTINNIMTDQPTDTPVGNLLIFMFFWTIFEIMVLNILFKREVLVISKEKMSIGKKLFGIKMEKVKHYDILKIHKLQLASETPETDIKLGPISVATPKQEHLQFEYEGKKVLFCEGINTDEANILRDYLADILYKTGSTIPNPKP